MDSATNEIGLLDIGSNTIKAFIYSVKTDAIYAKAHQTYHTQLLKYVKGNMLSEDGLSSAISDISSLVAFLEANGCKKIYSFATEALRSCGNAETVRFEIMTKTGIDVAVLTGKEEAHCDFESLKRFLPERFFWGVDIGGGSCQTVSQGERGVYYESFPFGALRISERFMHGCVPNISEEKNIVSFVTESIMDVPREKTETVYAMGGSAFAMKRIIGGGAISCKDIDNLIVFLRKLGPNAYDYLNAHAYGREKTLAAGMIALRTIAKRLDAHTISVMPNGVREGYLILKSSGQMH